MILVGVARLIGTAGVSAAGAAVVLVLTAPAVKAVPTRAAEPISAGRTRARARMRFLQVNRAGGSDPAPDRRSVPGSRQTIRQTPNHGETAIVGSMSGEARLVYDDALTGYDFGRGHPMSPIRVQLTIRLAEQLGILDHLPVVPAPVASDELLRTVHTAEYVEAVKRAGENPDVPDLDHGLGSDDTYCFPRMHEVSAQIAGASVEAARSVWEGEVLHAANIAGGLHHAMPNRASGFCVYNDPAVAIQWLLDNGAERVAYVDVDVHHGDGVQAVFYNDPRVLTVSLHESPTTLFPGTGSAGETGGPGAEGSAVNVALPPGTGDAG